MAESPSPLGSVKEVALKGLKWTETAYFREGGEGVAGRLQEVNF